MKIDWPKEFYIFLYFCQNKSKLFTYPGNSTIDLEKFIYSWAFSKRTKRECKKIYTFNKTLHSPQYQKKSKKEKFKAQRQ